MKSRALKGQPEATSSCAGTNEKTGHARNAPHEDVGHASKNKSTVAEVPRPDSKLAGVIALLLRDKGASIEELAAATGPGSTDWPAQAWLRPLARGQADETTLARRPGPLPAAADLATELNRLEQLEIGELRVHYRNHSGRIAPARISRALLLRVLAYRMQVDACGDVTRETRRLLDHLGSVPASGSEEATPSAVPLPAQWEP